MASSVAVLQACRAISASSAGSFAELISPAGADQLEVLAARSQQLTQQRFGKVIRLFAPLYLSFTELREGFHRIQRVMEARLHEKYTQQKLTVT